MPGVNSEKLQEVIADLKSTLEKKEAEISALRQSMAKNQASAQEKERALAEALQQVKTLRASNLEKAHTVKPITPASVFPRFTGKVVAITDGDTIQVMHDGKAEKIRLYGIDCPEAHQAFGQKAKQYASTIMFQKTVTVESRGKDYYGRTIGVIYTPEDKSANDMIVASGFAWWYREYAKTDKTLPLLEEEAKKEKRGLWADPNPIPPWDFRKGGDNATNAPEVSEPTLRARPSPAPRSTVQPYTRRSGSTVKTYTRTSPTRTSSTKEATVYVTRTGKKYHRSSCQYLKSSKIPKTLSSAKRSYSACSRCSP